MKQDRLMGALSLAKRAGKLGVGFDAVKEAAQKGVAALVLVAVDTSEGTWRRVQAACEGVCPVARLPQTQAQLSNITRKPAGVLAVNDGNFATLCMNALATAHEEEAD